MAKEKEVVVAVPGVVLELLPDTFFSVRLETGPELVCHIARHPHQRLIRLLEGDRVMVEASSYDLTRGRITSRIM